MEDTLWKCSVCGHINAYFTELGWQVLVDNKELSVLGHPRRPIVAHVCPPCRGELSKRIIATIDAYLAEKQG